MALDLFDIWYFVIGFLLSNGVPHFVFGRAGKIFRSPFGQRSPPKVNVYWGTANFAAASIITLFLAYLGLFDSYSMVFLLVGFLLVLLMFGVSIRRFLSE